MTKLNKCIHCDHEAHAQWSDYDNGYRVECSNVMGCKNFTRIYGEIKKWTEEAWNLANPKEKKEDV